MKSASQITARLEKELHSSNKVTKASRQHISLRCVMLGLIFVVTALPVAFVKFEPFGVFVSEAVVRKTLGLSAVQTTTAGPGTYMHALEQFLSFVDFQSAQGGNNEFVKRAALKHQFTTASHEAFLASSGQVTGSQVLHHPSDLGTDTDKYNVPWVKADTNGNHPFQKLRQYQSLNSLMSDAFSDFDSLLMAGWAVNMTSLDPVAATFTENGSISIVEGNLLFSSARATHDDKVACRLLGTLLELYADMNLWGLRKTIGGGVEIDDGWGGSFGGKFALDLVSKVCTEDTSGGWAPHSSANISRFFYFRRPSHTKYGPHQWMWDSCFHIMIDSHSPVDFMGGGRWDATVSNGNISFKQLGSSRKIASESALPNPFRIISGILELRSLLRFQSPNGFVPEMTYWFPADHQQGVAQFLFGYSDPGGRATDITQMPMLGMALQRLYTAVRRVERAAWASKQQPATLVKPSTLLLRHFVHKIAGLYRYWLKERDPRGEDLVSIIHPWESGLDASPLYDPVHELLGNAFPTNCTSAQCAIASLNATKTPTASTMYPRFVSRLYQYRHHRKWSLKAIFSDRDRFEVQDVGVNAVLAYNIRLLHRLVSYASKAATPNILDAGVTSQVYFELNALAAEVDAERVVKAIFSKLVSDDHGVPVILSRGWLPSQGAMVFLPADTIQQFFVTLLYEEDANHSKHEYDVLAALFSKLGSEDPRFQIHSVEGAATNPRRGHTYHPPNTSILKKFEDQVVIVEQKERTIGGGYGVGSFASPTTFKEALMALEDGGVSLSRWRMRQMDRDLAQPLLYTTWGVPTTAVTDHLFEAKDSALMWRGPSWPTTNWFIFEGLLNVMKATIAPNRSIRTAALCAIRARKVFLMPAWGQIGGKNIKSMIKACEFGEHENSTKCHHEFCVSVHMVKSLLQQWMALSIANGFSEFYNPLTGQPLGQQGLGMSFSLLEVLLRSFGDDGHTFGQRAVGEKQRFSSPRDVGAALVLDLREYVLSDVAATL